METPTQKFHKEQINEYYEEFIKCPCDDPSCKGRGEVDPETEHIMNCSCQKCHHYYSKI